MANTITIFPANLRVGPTAQQVGVIPFSITSTETYATASSGITIDFADFLGTLPVETRPKFTDIIGVYGAFAVTTALAGYIAVFTKTTTASQFTVRFFAGAIAANTNELGDGALPAGLTIRGLLAFVPGAQN